jgi:hypothetical protein
MAVGLPDLGEVRMRNGKPLRPLDAGVVTSLDKVAGFALLPFMRLNADSSYPRLRMLL